MRNKALYTVDAVLRILFVAVALISHRPLSAQIPELRARVQEMIKAAAKNKQALTPVHLSGTTNDKPERRIEKQEHFQAPLGLIIWNPTIL